MVDVLDVTLNSTAAFLTGSVVMMVEALQGCADIVADLFLIVGLKRSSRPRDTRHPFGYGREIYVWALFAAFAMLVLVAGISIYSGWRRFISPDPVGYMALAYGVLAISIATNGYSFWVSFRRLMYNKNGNVWRTFISSPLVETKTTFVFDLMGIAAAAFGLVALILYGITGDVRFDGLGAISIGIVMAVLAILLIIGVKEMLVGKRASAETERRIRESAVAVREVKEVLDLRTTYIGINRILVNMEVHLQENLHTEQIEGIIDCIKTNVQEENPSVYHIQVELETPEEEIA